MVEYKKTGWDMKSKTFWGKALSKSDPFTLPKRISKLICSSAAEYEHGAGPKEAVKFIWLHVDEEGVLSKNLGDAHHPVLESSDWLNIIDESAALGAEWMVIRCGASLSQCPYLWEMCKWAQEVHRLRVGLHLTTPRLSEEDLEELTKLDPSLTYIVADDSALDSLRYLEASGVRLCAANVHEEDRKFPCENPGAMACVSADGRLYSCGLVLGNEHYALGHSMEKPFGDVVQDADGLRMVPAGELCSDGGCDACPPLMVKRFMDAASPS